MLAVTSIVNGNPYVNETNGGQYSSLSRLPPLKIGNQEVLFILNLDMKPAIMMGGKIIRSTKKILNFVTSSDLIQNKELIEKIGIIINYLKKDKTFTLEPNSSSFQNGTIYFKAHDSLGRQFQVSVSSHKDKEINYIRLNGE